MRILLLPWWRLLGLAAIGAGLAWAAGAAQLSWAQLADLLAILIVGVWTAPKTWTAVVVSVADLNTHIRDNLTILKTCVDDSGHTIDAVIQTKTANYTIVGTDDLVRCPSGTFTVTLPTAVGKTGKPFKVKNLGSGTITMAATSAQTIDGAAASSVILLQNDSYTFESDGANWMIT